MKRLIMFILMLAVLCSIAFAGELSGETRVDAVYDTATEETVYAIDAGAVYEAGFLKIGADAYYDTNDDLDIGIPITATFGNLVLKAEPGADNLIVEDAEIYVFDGDITYTMGIFKFTYGFGIGTDELLDMSGEVTVTDLVPGVVINAVWADASDVENDVFGTVEVGATIKY